MAGRYESRPGGAGPRPAFTIIRALPEDAAREIAETGPLVRGRVRYVIRPWTRTF
jgi:hypothetical protein